MNDTPIKAGWSYKHEIGIIATSNIIPTLVVTENKYWNGKSWGYNYYPLGVTYKDEQDARNEKDKLNIEYNLPNFFNSDNSQDFLLKLQDRFTDAKIKKITG